LQKSSPTRANSSSGRGGGGFGRRDNNGKRKSKRTRGSTQQPSSSSAAPKEPPLSGDDMVPPEMQRLPSIQDLFPPDMLSSSASRKSSSSSSKPEATAWDSRNPPQPLPSPTASPLDGVLPVSDLFYRSSQDDDDEEEDDDEDEHDDEELPFSAEQSDAISSDDNKIRIRRNLAGTLQNNNNNNNKQTVASSSSSSGTSNNSNKSGRKKMSRRGMEMLVGGVPINADPPQRMVGLQYDNGDKETTADWASTITLTTRDFGPLLHTDSVSRVTAMQRGLFCEHFVHSAIKWDICPADLQQIVKSHRSKKKNKGAKTPTQITAASENSRKSARLAVDVDAERPAASESEAVSQAAEGAPSARDSSAAAGDEAGPTTTTTTRGLSSKSTAFQKTHSEPTDHGDEDFFESNGEFSFEIGVSLEELQSGESGGADDGSIFRAVFARAFMSILEKGVGAASRDESEDFSVDIPNLVLKESDDGYTQVTVEFTVTAGFATSYSDMERRVKRLGAVFTQAMDDGDIAIAIAAAAREEERWPESLRDRVVEECLFQDDEGAEELADFADDILYSNNKKKKAHGDDTGSPVLLVEDELILGGGAHEGVFYDLSSATDSPYGGEIGLRLVDAVVERAKQRQPRVIAIGDVHGCIDELQDLLRQCDYRPGDLVVFLGDLVCKGPDSISVVQMAREIGAIGVRGNHDFEVVRWHQAIKSGVDPPVVRSEHFHIASCLSKADMKWMHSLPWYIMSRELESLFVHAGFVSGIRLKKQNPRLMMNMRSILPDGTVTSKFFNNWPWARLWDGPQTVLFGHDADRGLQQYEHAIGLDTGCVYGGRLTACILPEKRLVSVQARREYFKHRRKHYD